jgi:hypothetical protein
MTNTAAEALADAAAGATAEATADANPGAGAAKNRHAPWPGAFLQQPDLDTSWILFSVKTTSTSSSLP